MVQLAHRNNTRSSYKVRLRGWLSYAFASEVFAVVSLTTFLPLCLEQFARDNGYLAPARTEPCNSNLATASLAEGARCVVKIGWGWVDSASFSLYIYSISVALQAITVISTGGIADTPTSRKPLLLTFASIGSISAALFLVIPLQTLVSPLWWLLAALLTINANVGFGASVVAMNSYLPGLARDSPEVGKVLDEIDEATTPEARIGEGELDGAADEGYSSDAPEAPLIRPSENSSDVPDGLRALYESTLSTATSRISSLGIALGYGAGITLLVLTMVPVTLMKGSTFSLRMAIGLSGVWWAFFSLPAAWWLPSGSEQLDAGGQSSWAGAEVPTSRWRLAKQIAAAWKRLGRMISPHEILKLRNTFKFLLAWFLLSDAFTTISSTAVLFGKTTLHMPASSLILVGALAPTFGIVGAMVWPVLQRRWRWSNLRALVTLVVVASLIPVYGCLGFLPVFQDKDNNVKFGGLTTTGEMYGLAIIFGSVYGAFQSYARAFYAELCKEYVTS